MMEQKINFLKILEKIFIAFPIFHFITVISFLSLFIIEHKPIWALSTLLSVYVLPVLIWRLLFLKIPEGKQHIGKKSKLGSSWLISHYIQYLFILFPAFEKALLLIPGAYSLWLRLWGSKIGKSVIWAPVMSIHDRPLIEVGDYVIIGGHTNIASHFLIRQNNTLNSYIKKVNIGSKVIIGAESSLGPGSNIIDDSFLPAHSRALMGRIERGQFGKTTRT